MEFLKLRHGITVEAICDSSWYGSWGIDKELSSEFKHCPAGTQFTVSIEKRRVVLYTKDGFRCSFGKSPETALPNTFFRISDDIVCEND